MDSIIVDIDGTIADLTHRLPHIKQENFKKDWKKFFAGIENDKPIKPIIQLIDMLGAHGTTLIFCSGRPDDYLMETFDWLDKHVGNWDYQLYMRPSGDFRPDYIIKRELLAQIRADGYDPKIAIDDRKQVVDMWREEGLICLQCAEGDF